MSADWRALASAKRQAILDSIPPKWRIEKIPSNEEQKDVTGAFAHQYLSKEEVKITESDAVEIANKIASGTWTAVEVLEAFCHRASIAHQLVGSKKISLNQAYLLLAQLFTRDIFRCSTC
jgi:amidase